MGFLSSIFGGGGSSSTTVQAPQMSAEEKALLQKQLALMESSEQESALLKPYLYQSLGLKEVQTPTTTQAENPEWAKWNQARQAFTSQPGIIYNNDEYGSWSMGSPSASAYSVPEPTRYLDQTTYATALQKLSDEERYASMNDYEKAQYDVALATAQRQKDALAGKYSSPALEDELGTQLKDLESYMSRKLGSNWRESTPGIQSLSEFNKKAGLLREEARNAVISNTGSLNLSSLSGLMNMNNNAVNQYATTPNRYSGLLGGYQSALQPYQYYQGLGYQANATNAQLSNQSSSSMMGGLGSLLGTAGNIYGMSRIGTGSMF